MSTPTVQLAGLQTEDRNPQSVNIDRVSTVELCQILNKEDWTVPAAVEPCIPVIAGVIDVLSERVRNGGRVFYIGAGTSGRLGVLDASEIPPTYSAPPGTFIALMAGGDYALRHAKEGAEDDRDAAKADLAPFNFDPTVDSLIGIASSGRTPYVLGGLAYVKSLGATTIALVCVSPSAAGAEGNADHLIAAVTGPEVVTGSTRMKAGTVTKLVLNMISTGIMIKLGKTYGNLMIDVKATNVKLKQRARNILRFVGGDACKQNDDELDGILQGCGGSVKLAAVTIVLKVPVTEAEERLHRNMGVLAKVFEEAKESESRNDSQDEGLVLCVDAGGTSCKAVIMSKNGEMGIGASGPCNVTNVGIDAAMSTMSKAIQEAVDNCATTRGRQFGEIKLSSAWVGMAGYGRPSLSPAIDKAVSKLMGLSLGANLEIMPDIDLLPVSFSGQKGVKNIVVLVAGTGSIAMRYAMVNGQPERTHRVGGWGYLLGDDGSGYSIGRAALRLTLESADSSRLRLGDSSGIEALSPLRQAVFRHFQEMYPAATPTNLLSTVLAPEATLHGGQASVLATTRRIAGVAKVVLSLARTDAEARAIVDEAIASLVGMVMSVLAGSAVEAHDLGLVLAGGLMQDKFFKEKLVTALDARMGSFRHVKRVTDPAVEAARYLNGRSGGGKALI